MPATALSQGRAVADMTPRPTPAPGFQEAVLSVASNPSPKPDVHLGAAEPVGRGCCCLQTVSTSPTAAAAARPPALVPQDAWNRLAPSGVWGGIRANRCWGAGSGVHEWGSECLGPFHGRPSWRESLLRFPSMDPGVGPSGGSGCEALSTRGLAVQRTLPPSPSGLARGDTAPLGPPPVLGPREEMGRVNAARPRYGPSGLKPAAPLTWTGASSCSGLWRAPSLPGVIGVTWGHSLRPRGQSVWEDK